MIFRRPIVKLTSSLLLLFAMGLPFVVQFAMALEDHEHVICEEQKSHFHEDAPLCFVCDYRLVIVSYDTPQAFEIIDTVFFPQEEESYTSLFYQSNNHSNLLLRGPPQIHI